MSNWWNEDLCKMCDAGMCEAVDSYKAQGLSERGACRKAAQDTEGFYTEKQIQRRYRYHRGLDSSATNCGTKMLEMPPAGETCAVSDNLSGLAEAVTSGDISPEEVEPVLKAYGEAVRRRARVDERLGFDWQRVKGCMARSGGLHDCPPVPDDWDYSKSVSNMKRKLSRLDSLSHEICGELDSAGENLPRVNKSQREYCDAVGIDKPNFQKSVRC